MASGIDVNSKAKAASGKYEVVITNFHVATPVRRQATVDRNTRKGEGGIYGRRRADTSRLSSSSWPP